MTTGRKLAVAFLVLSIAFTVSRFMGGGGHPGSGQFPGVGSEAAWKEARAIAHESANATRAQDYDRAITLGQQAIDKYPNDADIVNNTGFAMLLRGNAADFRQSEVLFKQAIALRDDDARFWDNLGRALSGQERYKEARDAFAKALECHPSSEQAEELQKNIEQIDAAAQPGSAPQQ